MHVTKERPWHWIILVVLVNCVTFGIPMAWNVEDLKRFRNELSDLKQALVKVQSESGLGTSMGMIGVGATSTASMASLNQVGPGPGVASGGQSRQRNY